MSKLLNYSLLQLLAEWAKYKKVEHYSNPSSDNAILGVSVAAFLSILILYTILWVIALVLLVNHGHEMPTWAVVLGIVFLFLPGFGPIATILLALLVRE